MVASIYSSPVGLEGELLSEPAEPISTQGKKLLALWLSKHDGSGVPCRSSFSLLDLKDVMSSLYMFEAINGGEDFYIRLVGTGVSGMFDTEYTGVKWSDPEMQPGAWRLPIFRKVLARDKPSVLHFRLGPLGAPLAVTENLMAPMTSSDGVKMMILGVSVVIGKYDENGLYRELSP